MAVAARLDKLDIRRRPVQARSAATFDLILDTAIHLLEDVGWDGFTTNILAERAGIGIQTLYRYFPNKLSVVATLSQRAIEEWESWFEDAGVMSPPGPEVFSDGMALFIQNVRNQTGGVAIRQAMNASLALRDLDRADNRRYAIRIVDTLIQRHPEIDRKEAEAAILTSIEASLAVIDLAMALPKKEGNRLVNNCLEMQDAFLSAKFPLVNGGLSGVNHGKAKSERGKRS